MALPPRRKHRFWKNRVICVPGGVPPLRCPPLLRPQKAFFVPKSVQIADALQVRFLEPPGLVLGAKMGPKWSPNRFRYAFRRRLCSRYAFFKNSKTISAIVAASAESRPTLPYCKTQGICNIFNDRVWRATVPRPLLDHPQTFAEINKNRSQNGSREPPRALLFGKLLQSAVWTPFWTPKAPQRGAQRVPKRVPK